VSSLIFSAGFWSAGKVLLASRKFLSALTLIYKKASEFFEHMRKASVLANADPAENIIIRKQAVMIEKFFKNFLKDGLNIFSLPEKFFFVSFHDSINLIYYQHALKILEKPCET
jgi:hypothetical protein